MNPRSIITLAIGFAAGFAAARTINRTSIVGMLEAVGIIDLDEQIDLHPAGSWSRSAP